MATLADVKGASYGPTIKAQLDEERASKSSLEARGIGIITTSGVLASLLLGLVTFTRGNVDAAHLSINPVAAWVLILAVILFAAAAILGLLSNLPAKYAEADVEVLKKRVDPKEWSTPDPIEAARHDAKLYIEILDDARVNNEKKAQRVWWGLIAEASGVIAVAMAVLVELLQLT